MKRILHYFAALMCILACNPDGLDSDKNNNELPDLSEYGEFQLAENVSFMTEEKTDMFSLVTNDQITIPLSVAEEKVPGTGTVIVCPITEKTPSGLLVKVVSVSKTASEYVLAIEPAMLNEAFSELKVNSTFDISSFVDKITDEDGNTIEAELVSSDIWDEFDKSPDDTTFTIPTKYSGTGDFSIKFPIKNKWFKGYVFTDFSTTVDIDLSDGKLKKFNISLNKQTGVAGGIGLMTEGKFKAVLVEKSVSFKPFLIPGTPLVICPKIYLEDTFEVKGEMSAKFNLRLLCENQTYKIGFNGEKPSFDSKNGGMNGNHLKFEFLNADANMELAATCGCKFSLYHEDLLSFGVESSAKQGLHLQKEILMENNGLLIDNPVIEVTPALEASAYCETILFCLVGLGEDGRASYTWDFGLPSYEITPLPQFINVKKNKAGGTLTASSEVEEFCLLNFSEEGFALFEIEENTPLVHMKFRSKSATKATKYDEVTFTLPDPDKEYEARSYVVANGKHYYGPSESIWVDLGLPSGILWAKYNIGASSPEEYGGYYAWGETEEKNYYDFETYNYFKFYDTTNDIIYFEDIGTDISGTLHDVCFISDISGARMPTVDEFRELIDCCSIDNGIYNNTKGKYIIGNNGNKIFLPLAGYRDYEEKKYSGEKGAYWSSTALQDQHGQHASAYGLLCADYGYDFEREDYAEISDLTRSYGYSVRPVKDKEE